jgi:hypothetical protein
MLEWSKLLCGIFLVLTRYPIISDLGDTSKFWLLHIKVECLSSEICNRKHEFQDPMIPFLVQYSNFAVLAGSSVTHKHRLELVYGI